MGSVFFGVLYGFWKWLLGFFLLAISIFGTHRLLFGSIWFHLSRRFLETLSWAFFGFHFLLVSFFILSTQGTFNGDGHLLFIFSHLSSVVVALHRH